MLNIGTAVGYLLLDTTNFRTALTEAQKDLEQFQKDSATISDKSKSIGDAFTTVGSTLTKNVTLPLVGLGTVAVTTAAEFEQKMSNVAATSGATAAEMELLTDTALIMGAKTKFSAVESADAFGYMAQAGWKAKEMVDGIEGTMNLAAASGEDLALVSSIVTNAISAFGEEADQAGRYADVLAVAAADTNTNVAELGEAFKYAAPVAGSMGLSLEDTAAALGIMANSGIVASQAGTSLRAVLLRLSTNAGASSKSLGALDVLTEKLGVQFYNAAGEIRPLNDVITDTREAWKGLTQEEQNNYAKKIAGQNAISGFLALMNAEDKTYQDLTEHIDESSGAAYDMSQIMMDNLNGSIEQLGGAVETLLIQLGTALTPTIQKVTEFLTMLVEKLTQVDEGTINTVAQIGMFVAALGPILLIVGKVMGGISNFIGVLSKISPVVGKVKTALSGLDVIQKLNPNTMFGTMGQSIGNFVKSLTPVQSAIQGVSSALNFLVSPIGLVVAAIAGLVAGFVYLYTTNEEFRDRIKGVWDAIVSGIMPVIDNLKQTFSDFGTKMIQVWSQIVHSVSPVLEMLGGLFKDVGGAIMNALAPAIGDIATLIMGGLSVAFTVLISVVQAVMEGISVFASGIAAVFQTISGLIMMVVAIFSGETEKAKMYFRMFVDGLITMVSTLPLTIITFFKTMFTNIIENAVTFFSNMDTDFGDWMAGLISKVGEFVGSFFEAGANLMSGLWDGLKSIVDSIYQWFEGVIEKVAGFFSRIGGAQEGASSAVSQAQGRASLSANANGLSYVPFDGYRATLHKGEKVLTAGEAEEYNSNSRTGNTFVFQSPKQIDEREAQRLLEQTLYDMDK